MNERFSLEVPKIVGFNLICSVLMTSHVMIIYMNQSSMQRRTTQLNIHIMFGHTQWDNLDQAHQPDCRKPNKQVRKAEVFE